MMTGSASPELGLSSADAPTLIHLLRENLRILSILVARYEVGRMETEAEQRTIRCAADVAEYFQAEMADLAQEQLRVLLLDTKNRILGSSFVYQGSLNTVVIRLGECFREAVRVGAASIILVHNHPSSDPTPSPEDVQFTKDAGQAGELLEIDVLDHIIVTRRAHTSLREHGFYKPASSTGRQRGRGNGRTVHRGEESGGASVHG